MMGTCPKSSGVKRHKARIWAVPAAAACAAALVAMLSPMSPLLAQGTVSEFAKTPSSPSGAAKPPAAQAQSQPPAAAPSAPPLPTQRPAASGGSGKAPAPASPVGSGSGWAATPVPSGAQQHAGAGGAQAPGAQAPTDKAASLLKVNTYFNDLKSLKGGFVQTEADGSQKRGKFYIERPGKIRFDYAPPSKLHIISDGEYLAIEDHDLGTSDRYPLDSTPFRLLLSKDVDLTRDARILGLVESETSLTLALEDKTQNSGGQIRLFFGKPDMQLKEWIITDPQGQNTKISISDVEANKELTPDLFKFSEVGFQGFNR